MFVTEEDEGTYHRKTVPDKNGERRAMTGWENIIANGEIEAHGGAA
jgi:hypothetical protein